MLAASDEREQLPMASITKLMTALVALEHASLDDVATISRQTASVGESTINLRPGERVTLRDLIRAALVQSANDAANAIAAFVGRGSVERFVELMNARAEELGLTDTHFANPDGLDAPGHVSSARDVTKLARVAMHDPFIRQTVRLVDTTAAGRRLHTWNDLLSTFPNLLGVKTGHTNGAGWSQVAAARGGGVTIYATAARRRDARRPERRPDGAAALGPLALPHRLGDRRHEDVRHGTDRVREARRARGRRQARAPRDPRRAAARRARRRSPSRRRCPCGRASGSARCRCSTAAR